MKKRDMGGLPVDSDVSVAFGSSDKLISVTVAKRGMKKLIRGIYSVELVGWISIHGIRISAVNN